MVETEQPIRVLIIETEQPITRIKEKSLIGPNLAALFKRECRHSGYRGIEGIQYMSFQLRLRIYKN